MILNGNGGQEHFVNCYYGGDTEDLSEGAHQILDVIMACYPGHNVKVWGYSSGVFHITHLDFEQVGGHWGMALKGQQFYSASHMRREVIMKFGEWLERANLARGASNGDEIVSVDGVPLKNHANRPKPEIDIDKLIAVGAAAERETRDQPRIITEAK